MKNLFEIITEMYEILNVDQLTDLLTDKLYRNKRHELSRGTCVVIAPLAHTNPEDIVKEGVLNVNIHAPVLSNKMVDETTLDEIATAVVDLIEAHQSTDNYLIFDIMNQGLATDDRDQTYVNMRVNYLCEQ